jgi:hypothetical protein
LGEFADCREDPAPLFLSKRAFGEEAKLRTVEDDKRRTIAISLCWPARICSSLLITGSIIATIVVLAAYPGLALHPFGPVAGSFMGARRNAGRDAGNRRSRW